MDVAKAVFEVAVSEHPGQVRERHRFSQERFRRYLGEQPPATLLLEACGSAHYWGRQAQAHGHQVAPSSPLSATCSAFPPPGTSRATWRLTPREHSTGQHRRLGAISKHGDTYLRLLLIHGARAVLCHAKTKTAPAPDRLRAWALQLGPPLLGCIHQPHQGSGRGYPICISGGTSGFIKDAPPSA